MNTTVSIIESKKEEIIKYLKENTYQYSEEGGLDKEVIKALTIDIDNDAITDYLVEINDFCADNQYEDVLYTFSIDEDDLSEDEKVELREIILDNMIISFENWFKGIKVLIHIPMLSNYDCINSYTDMDYHATNHYIADCVDILKINRKDFKAELKDTSLNFHGTWKNEKSKIGKEAVSVKDFAKEVLHLSCGANLLTFVLNATLWDLYKVDSFDNLNVTIPKGTLIGFLSTFQGGGTNYDARTKQDFKVTLKKGFCKDYKPFLRLDLDCEYEYGFKSIYGVNTYNEPLLIIE